VENVYNVEPLPKVIQLDWKIGNRWDHSISGEGKTYSTIFLHTLLFFSVQNALYRYQDIRCKLEGVDVGERQWIQSPLCLYAEGGRGVAGSQPMSTGTAVHMKPI
jgi:hypothetical protein